MDGIPLDTNQDGVVDQVAIDTTGEGVADTWNIDTNQDGVADQTAIDTTGEGVADTWNIDTNQDGVADQTAIDTTGEGVADTWNIDTNQDGVAEEVFTSPEVVLNTAEIGGPAPGDRVTVVPPGASTPPTTADIGGVPGDPGTDQLARLQQLREQAIATGDLGAIGKLNDLIEAELENRRRGTLWS